MNVRTGGETGATSPQFFTNLYVKSLFSAYIVLFFACEVAPEYMYPLSHIMNGSYTGDIFADDLLKSS